MINLIGIKPKTGGLYLDQLYLKRIDDQIHLAEKDLWILTEERPKIETIETILDEFIKDYKEKFEKNSIKIKPIFEDGKFSSKYEILGIKICNIGKIYLKIVSGAGSFVDYLVYREENYPDVKKDTPLYVIEETKTTPAESRDLHYQRITKFAILDFIPKIQEAKKLFIYSIKTRFSTIPTSFEMASRMLKNMNVKILGLESTIINIDDKKYDKFTSLKQMCDFKNSFAKKDSGKDTPQRIDLISSDKIEVSARLQKGKNQKSWSDPSTGFVAAVCFVIRQSLGFSGEIKIVNHRFKNNPFRNKSKSKLVILVSQLKNIKLGKWSFPVAKLPVSYFKETKGEKRVSILLHLAIEFTQTAKIIYENHAGCEQGYFDTNLSQPEKYKSLLKVGTKKPDLIIIDDKTKEIFILEAEKSENAKNGIKQLKGFTNVEKDYCKKYYPGYKCERYVILYGKHVNAPEVIFTLTTKGEINCSKNCPQVIKDAVDKIQNS